jgi:hypothetical protein
MKIKRSLLVLAVLPLTISLQSSVLAQAGSPYTVSVGTSELTQRVTPAYTVGIAGLGRNQKSSFSRASLLADAAPSTSDTTTSTPYGAPSTADSALALASSSDQLNILERFLLNQTNSGQSTSERLNHLETLVLHKQRSGSVSDRIKNLIAALPEPAKTQVTTAIANLVMSEPTANPLAPPQPAPQQLMTEPTAYSNVVAPIVMPQQAPSSPLGSQPTLAALGTTSGGTIHSKSPDQITVLEQFFFDTTYPAQDNATRLSRIETLVFGEPQRGSDAQRLKDIISGLPPTTKTELSHGLSHAASALPTASSATGAAPAPSQVSTSQPADQAASTQPAAEVAVVQPGSPPTTQPVSANASADVATVFSGVQKLVQQFYPNAKVTVTGTKMHFEYKCKTEIGYYSQKKVYAPQYGGILGDISLEAGQYTKANKNRLPSEVEDGFHTNLTMAPYSSTQNDYLLTHMSFPPDVDLKFKGRFEKLINTFNAHDVATQSSAKTAARVAVLAHAAAAKAGAQAAALKQSQEYDVAYQTAFGSANMSEHRFPDGVFRVMLPDSIQSSHGTELGMAKTTYSAQGVGGTFEVSFVSLPSLPATGTDTDNLINSVSSDLVQQMHGTGVSQGFDTLKGQPGRQINVSSINGKPGYAALAKIFIANVSQYDSSYDQDGNIVETNTTPRYLLYEITAVGQQQWLNSPAVQNFISSFEFYGGSGEWTDGLGQLHWQDENGWEHWQDSQGQQHVWDEKHHDRKLGVQTYNKPGVTK